MFFAPARDTEDVVRSFGDRWVTRKIERYKRLEEAALNRRDETLRSRGAYADTDNAIGASTAHTLYLDVDLLRIGKEM